MSKTDETTHGGYEITYTPSLAERLWRAFGYRYHHGEEPDDIDALEWFVWDAEHPLSDLNHAEVIRQAETLEEALRGL